jgi:hypothetical protein
MFRSRHKICSKEGIYLLEIIDFVWLGIVFIGSVCLGLVIRKIYHGKKVVQIKEVKKAHKSGSC